MKNKILIISELNLIKTFLLPTITKLIEEKDVQCDCLIVTKIDSKDKKDLELVFTNVFSNNYPKGWISKIPKLRFIQYMYGLIKLTHNLTNYDVIHVNFHHYYYSLFASIIRKKTDRLYLTFFGSDFNEIEWFRHLGNKITIKSADKIFATNITLLKRIQEKYNLTKNKKEIGILMPLMETFQSFEKHLSNQNEKGAKINWGIKNRLIVCGYNAAPIVRHEEIIKVLIEIKDELLDFNIIFPMTYGHRANISRTKVKSLLELTSLNYKILEEFLSIEKLQDLRLATDIFIHIQSRDQMAASFLEHLAAGSIVITGKWLPYDSLVNLGIYFIRIEKIEDLKDVLSKTIINIENHKELCKMNRNIILKLVNWENTKYSWYSAYNLF